MGLNPLRLVTVVGPYGQFVGSSELVVDPDGLIGLRVLSLATVVLPEQKQQPDRGLPSKSA